jgi:hypothetical protein
VLLGIHLTLLLGPAVPVPAAPSVLEALESVEVTQNDEGRSGFQATFRLGRLGPTDVLEYPLLVNPQLRLFSRVIVIATLNVVPTVVMDGIITNHQVSPGSGPGEGTLTVTGEDVSIMMDLVKRRDNHPAQDDTLVVTKLIGKYAQYGLVPMVIPPPLIDPPIPVERVPVQCDTDLEHIKDLAERHGYVFYVRPGPVPGTNLAYWGPRIRTGLPQRALSVNMGPETNVDSVSFQYNGLAPTIVVDEVQDARTNTALPVLTFVSTRPPIVSQPALPFNMPNVRTALLENNSGMTYAQAFARAQAVTDSSVESVVTATGELDAVRYGGLLQPRGLVGLRGAGFSYDGMYYVKSVTHKIGRGQYKQSFNLTREGTGAITPVVVP